MDSRIDTLVFDVGGVLLDWNPERLFMEICGREDFHSHPLSRVIGGPNWLEMDRGILSLEKLSELEGGIHPEASDDIARFINRVAYHIPVKAGGFTAAREFKRRGYKLLLLSNFGREAWKVVSDRFDDFSLFDGGIISWEVELIKPDPAIYSRLIDRFELTPQKTLFIDDTEENIRGAQDLDIRGLYLKREMDLKGELEKALA